MRYSFFLLPLGALVCAILTPFSIRCAHAVGAVDLPDGERRLHPHPTPRLGGIALFSAVLFLSAMLSRSVTLSVWLAGGGLITALGVSDDLYELSPLMKLSAMLAICALPAAFGLAPRALSLGAHTILLSHPFDNLFSLFWVLLLTNAFNLIDGADGLCASLAAVGALSLFLSFGNPAALLLLGAVLGFLPYNLPLRAGKTRSFLGDTGALFLGYSLAVLSSEGYTLSFSHLLFFAIPVFDLFHVFTSRILRGKNPFRADRTHLHHRLSAKGYGWGGVLSLCTLYALLFSSVGLVLL